jgi:hypothetical protein
MKKRGTLIGIPALLSNLKGNLDSLAGAAASQSPSSRQRRRIDDALRAIGTRIDGFLRELDPIKQPSAIFDPTNPKIIGRFISLALVAQPRDKLAAVERFYGSGVYAIYYRGDFPPYKPIAKTETPIYVGKAGPALMNARTPIAQGERLARRLADHRKNISKAVTTISIDDFECRFLLVQSGYETAAEDYLIYLFKPIWNNETGILYGLGKHGDAATTRQNKRSPWDTLHPGRTWAGKTVADARPKARIMSDLAKHFANTRIYNDLNDVLREFLDGLRQI